MVRHGIVHHDVLFKDAVVYLTGHLFTSCTFTRCTLVIRDPDEMFNMSGCHTEGVVWRLDMVLADDEDMKRLDRSGLIELIRRSVVTRS